ncbi:efflux RND transporter permease subunit [Desulfohalobium retbaense]|uniref:Acriflavin resistance protein n=1 Tax=Desulfohalobium retbaense (strain ATCC 49708 / DSM 5692 / JCM 16813 / HR100) TaxID=485915 RepID=C8X5G3_DESRD|nr:efflux RND transporter permease subunit [Desulfohalobium retbaense]ACV69660.1 acriflavin resistance protein [Desulfohalobium retbaense DSM 5692]
MNESASPKRGPLAWMAGNTVAANLLMLVLLVGGLIIGQNVTQEVFPEFSLDTVSISVPYPGASPEEVESGIILALEEAVQGVEGIKEVRSTASEGVGRVTVEAQESADLDRLWQDVKAEVDRINTFPDEAEEPSVTIASRQREVISFVLYGSQDQHVLRNAAEQTRDALLNDPGITQVDLVGTRDLEIKIEVPQEQLRRYGLTLGDISSEVRNTSLEVGAGTLETPGGDILVRVKDLRETAREYRQLPILNDTNGSRILLEDIGSVTDGFADTDAWASYNGQKALMIEVYRVGDQTPVGVATAARKVVEAFNEELPEPLQISVVRDLSEIFNQRAELLLKNAFLGLGLVFVLLAIFLEMRLAFWVSLGIPISFLGAFLFLPLTSFSINMVTMFAFIVTLGIVVDDAIVVGENIYAQRRQGQPLFQAAVAGVREVAMPVTFSVLTNMLAFLPLFFVPGMMGKIFRSIPIVVVCVFLVSLIESLLVLPAHLGHQRPGWRAGPLAPLARLQAAFSDRFERFVAAVYGPFLRFVLRNRYSVLAVALAGLMATVGYIQSGRMGLVLFPTVESDFAYVEAVLPYGTAAERVRQVETRLVQAGQEVVEANGEEQLGEGIFSRVSENTITIRLFLTDAQTRPLSTSEVTRAWREQIGPLPGLESLEFQADRGGPGSGKALTVRLSHRNQETLETAGQSLAETLEDYTGVSDIDDGSAQGKRQYDIHLLPAGRRAGLSSREVANQVRYALYGAEAVKLQRGRNEVTVRIRLPQDQRRREATLENLVLQSPRGEIPLRDAARLVPGRAYTAISRTEGRRVIAVTANVQPRSRTERLVQELKAEVLPQLASRYKGLSFSFQGRQADIRESVSALIYGLLLALLGIYAMLAIPFKSYLQPLIIMICIPFGLVGAVLGHLIMGYSLSVMSLFGVVALAGVVVNDSLVLIDFANRRRRAGTCTVQAVINAAKQRFRPILLTTLTTFGGLAPMIWETSMQARFLIPMAISLGYGIVFATTITLLLVPCLYLILEDGKRLAGLPSSVAAEDLQC